MQNAYQPSYHEDIDICNILEYINTRDALFKHTDIDYKLNFIYFLDVAKCVCNIDVKTVFINESELYSFF